LNVTRNSLLHALAEHNLELDEKAVEKLMKAYDSLSTFPDVIPTLTELASKSNITAVVFSNGTESMVSNSVLRSKDLSPKAKVFHDLITVDDVKKYKPAPEVYAHLAKKVGKETSQMEDIWLISGNPFDIVGSRSSGMKAIWVDRAGRGLMDTAVPELQPTVIVHNLEEIIGVIEKYTI
jgi:2-haloacid dehalogenase